MSSVDSLTLRDQRPECAPRNKQTENLPGSETCCPGVVEKRDRKGSDGDLSADLGLG